jgi:hypothetical protein
MNIYWKAGILTFIIFLIGLLTGIYLVNQKNSFVFKSVDKFASELEESKIFTLYFDTFKNTEGFCKGLEPKLQALALTTDNLGKYLAVLEQDKKNDAVRDLKKKYVNSNIELWLYAVNMKRECKLQNLDTVLYFYLNDSICLDCKTEALVLEQERTKNQSLWVFALPTDMGLPLVESIMKQFGVEGAPAIVINEERTFNRLVREKELSDLLEK